ELPPMIVSLVPLRALAPVVTGAALLTVPAVGAAGAAAWQAASRPPAPSATPVKTMKRRRDNECGAAKSCSLMRFPRIGAMDNVLSPRRGWIGRKLGGDLVDNP